MLCQTTVLLGVGNTGEVYGVLNCGDVVAWIPYDDANVVRFKAVSKLLLRAGHQAALSYVSHDDAVRMCVLYPRGESCVEDAEPEEVPQILTQIGQWVAGFSSVGLAFYHFSPKHILRAPSGGYILTGLSHAFEVRAPPSPVLHDFGPYSLVGDTPLVFFSSGALRHAGVVELLMLHAVGVCTVLLVDGIASNIVACAQYSSTAAQIRLSLATDMTDPLRSHCKAPETVLSNIKKLLPRERCCRVC